MLPLSSATTSTPIPGTIPTTRRRTIHQVLEQEPWRLHKVHLNLEEEGDNRTSAIPPHRHHNTQQESSQVYHLYRTRDNRKGRHALSIHPLPHHPKPTEKHTQTYITPPLTNTLPSILHTLRLLFTTLPLHDISYLVALTFTIGSSIWVLNGFFAWLPHVSPRYRFPHEETVATGVTALVGCLVFVAGSVFLVIEAVNEDRSGCFGWAVEQVWDREEEKLKLRLVGERDGVRIGCGHHHCNTHNLVGRGPPSSNPPINTNALPIGASKPLQAAHHETIDPETTDPPNPSRTWIWFPPLPELRHHYLQDLGFLASTTQLFASLTFCLSGLVSLPLPHLSPTLTTLIYWLPQVLGSIGFVFSSFLFTLETQETWWKPNLRSLGWWVGAWNELGSVGFLVSGVWGLCRGGGYGAALATFWGSWAFGVGSVCQLYESLQKFPVERGRRGGEGGAST